MRCPSTASATKQIADDFLLADDAFAELGGYARVGLGDAAQDFDVGLGG